MEIRGFDVLIEMRQCVVIIEMSGCVVIIEMSECVMCWYSKATMIISKGRAVKPAPQKNEKIQNPHHPNSPVK